MRQYRITVFTVCLLLLALVAQASAVSVTISPEQIEEGDTITIGISGLQDGSIFALRMEAAIELDGASTFTYQSNQVSVPFGMESPRVLLLASPVTEAGLEASDGDTIKRMTQRTQTGEVRITQSLDAIPSGTIEVLKAFGKPVDGSDYVDMMLELSGTKKGPDAGSITFGLEGISDGSARIIVLVDGSEAMNQQITIGTPTVTPTPTTAPPTGGSSGSSGGTTTPVPVDQVSVSSLDGIVWLQTVASSVTWASPDDIRIIQSEPVNIPADWIALSGSYIISPTGISFQPPARLSFVMDGDAGTPFIAAYRDGGWTIVPSRVEGSSLVVEISGGGQYAMMSYHSDDPAPVVTEGPATPPVTSDAPLNEVPPTEAPAAEKSAGGLVAILTTGVAGLLLMGVRKRG
ncbi:hypothetical protein [Methanocalculus chunghsingensis]|nr:hypothetical protein [Methanocalculus chunghsingensis]